MLKWAQWHGDGLSIKGYSKATTIGLYVIMMPNCIQTKLACYNPVWSAMTRRPSHFDGDNFAERGGTTCTSGYQSSCYSSNCAVVVKEGLETVFRNSIVSQSSYFITKVAYVIPAKTKVSHFTIFLIRIFPCSTLFFLVYFFLILLISVLLCVCTIFQ